MRARWIFLIVSVIALVAAVGANIVRSPRRTPELRGYALARALGCFACHGPGATGGVPNPGSEEKQVPAGRRQRDDVREQRREGWRVPAYKDVLTDTEMDAIITYIEWLQD